MLNQDQVASAVRWALSTGGAFLVTKGYLNDDLVTWLVGGVGPIVALVWSMIYHSKPAAKVD
jgi:hypothetical protein